MADTLNSLQDLAGATGLWLISSLRGCVPAELRPTP